MQDKTATQSPLPTSWEATPTPPWWTLLGRPLVLCWLLLALFGCLMILNVTYGHSTNGRLAWRQLLWLLPGTAVLVWSARQPAERWRAWITPLCWLALGGLYLVLFMGVRLNGMRGWFRLSLGDSDSLLNPILLQPAELAKPIFLLMMARLLAPLDDPAERRWGAFAQRLGWLALWVVPIILQPDLGTASLYLLAFALLYFLRGGPLPQVAAFGGGLALLAGLAIWRVPHVSARLAAWWQPWAYAEGVGWQVVQNREALSAGGWWGRGFGHAEQARHYLPLPYSDGLAAALGETVGLVGLLLLLLGVLVALGLVWRQARQAAEPWAGLLLAGLAGMLALQTLLHLSVAAGLFPVTGITLPLLSYGGSSLISTCLSLGMLQSLVAAVPAATPEPASGIG
jgi:cell division protein FtsW (lipid II flippase)